MVDTAARSGAGTRARMLALALLGIGTLAIPFVLVDLRRDPSLLSALPDAELEVSSFERLRERFGLHRMVVVALRFPGGVFTREALGSLVALGRELRGLEGVSAVQSLTETPDLRPSADGFEAAELVPAVPADDAGLAGLRERLLAHPLVAGQLVSRDGAAAMLALSLAPRSDEAVLAAIAAAVARHAPRAEATFTGEPWVLAAMARGQARDGRAMGAALLAGLGLGAAVLARRSGAAAAGRALAVTLLAGAWAITARAQSDRPINDLELLVILSVVLAAWPGAAAIEAAAMPLGWRGLAPAVLLAATALACAKRSVTEVSKTRLAVAAAIAVLSLAALRRGVGRDGGPHRPPWIVLVVPVLVALVLATARAPAMLPEPVPPPRPDVLSESFGQGDVAIVSLRGDMRDPVVMQRVAALEDRIAALPGVARTQSLAGAVRHVGSLLGDGHRVPGDRGKLGNLLFFLDGAPELKSLVSDDLGESVVVATLAPSAPAASIDAIATLAAEANVALLAVERPREGAAREAHEAWRRLAEGRTLRDLEALGVPGERARQGLEPVPAAAVREGLLARREVLVASIVALGVDPALADAAAVAVVEGADPREAGLDEEEARALLGELALLGAQVEAEIATERLGAAGRARLLAHGVLMGLSDGTMGVTQQALADSDPAGLLPARAAPLLADAGGPAVMRAAVGRDGRRVLRSEGGAVVLGTAAAALASGSGAAAIPLLAEIAASAAGWLLGMMVAPTCLVLVAGVVLAPAAAGRTAALAALPVAVALMAAAAVVVLPGSRQTCLVLAALVLAGAAAHAGRAREGA